MPESEFIRNMDSESPGWRKVVGDPFFKKWLDDNEEKDFYSHLERRHLHYVSRILEVYHLTTRSTRRNLKTMNTSTTAKPKTKWELDRFKAGKELKERVNRV
jgi:hypothetical protein